MVFMSITALNVQTSQSVENILLVRLTSVVFKDFHAARRKSNLPVHVQQPNIAVEFIFMLFDFDRIVLCLDDTSLFTSKVGVFEDDAFIKINQMMYPIMLGLVVLVHLFNVVQLVLFVIEVGLLHASVMRRALHQKATAFELRKFTFLGYFCAPHIHIKIVDKVADMDAGALPTILFQSRTILPLEITADLRAVQVDIGQGGA